MWFAFILLSLSYWKQHSATVVAAVICCDLLSFYYLCRTGNNFWKCIKTSQQVVICFHFTIFVVLETTSYRISRDFCKLWFAFILLSLSYWKQPGFDSRMSHLCCDLLSFYYLCRTGNNSEWLQRLHPAVVICFHFTIFVVLETTSFREWLASLLLWFAFILLSLSYWKQPAPSFFESAFVVICFHFTIFVVLETTQNPGECTRVELWFAFILLSLSYWKQLHTAQYQPFASCDLLSFYYLCRTGNN